MTAFGVLLSPKCGLLAIATAAVLACAGVQTVRVAGGRRTWQNCAPSSPTTARPRPRPLAWPPGPSGRKNSTRGHRRLEPKQLPRELLLAALMPQAVRPACRRMGSSHQLSRVRSRDGTALGPRQGHRIGVLSAVGADRQPTGSASSFSPSVCGPIRSSGASLNNSTHPASNASAQLW